MVTVTSFFIDIGLESDGEQGVQQVGPLALLCLP